MIANPKWMVLAACCILATACQSVPHRQAKGNLVHGFEAWIPFEHGEYWGFKDQNGQTVIPARFRTVTEFNHHGLAAVLDDQGWVLIDVKGREVIRPYTFDNGPDYFEEGLARFVQDRKFGFFDESGKVVIQPQFDFAYPFKDGKAKVGWGCTFTPDGEHQQVSGGEWKQIDKTGKFLPR